MAMSNPAFSGPAFAAGGAQAAQLAEQQKANLTAAELTELYSRPSATPSETERMTYEDTIVKTIVSFALVFAGGAIGFFNPGLYLIAMGIGFVLALVNIFKKQPSAPLVLLYAAVQGVFLGGISRVVEATAPGIIYQALLATAAVVVVTLVLFLNGKVRESKKATKVFLIAGAGYALFSLINLVLQFTGVANDPWGLYSTPTIAGIPLGLIIGPLVILMAAYSLVLDFTAVKNGVEQGAPRQYAWKAAFGITLTVIWLYLELLRFISILRSN